MHVGMVDHDLTYTYVCTRPRAFAYTSVKLRAKIAHVATVM